jgi:hypothetical protein
MKIRKMTSKTLITAFSYSLDDLDVVRNAEEIARRNGQSFSAYVVELLKKDGKTEKNEAPLADPLNLPRQQVTEPDVSYNTLDIYMPYTEIRDHIARLDDPKKLAILIQNGRVMETVATTRRKKIVKDTRIIK